MVHQVPCTHGSLPLSLQLLHSLTDCCLYLHFCAGSRIDSFTWWGCGCGKLLALFVVTVLCKWSKMSNITFLTALFSSIAGQRFSLFGPYYQSQDLRLFSEQNSHQLAFVAHHMPQCFQSRVSDGSQLAPHPRQSRAMESFSF